MKSFTFGPQQIWENYIFLRLLTFLCVGVAGTFPPEYMGGMMAGQALGGIFPSLINILVIAFQVNQHYLLFIYNSVLSCRSGDKI